MTDFEPGELCCSCRSALGPKSGARECETCNEHACKKCMRMLADDALPYLIERPEELRKTYFCTGCHDRVVEPALEEYERVSAQANDVLIFSRPIRLIKKAQHALKTADCREPLEAKMKLAYQAVRDGYNALIEFEIVGEKVRNHGYQTQRWKAQGMPALVDAVKFAREAERDDF